MSTTILALDLGATTGWALRGIDGHITSGSERFKPQRFEGGGMRFLRFKRWLMEPKTIAQEIVPNSFILMLHLRGYKVASMMTIISVRCQDPLF